MMKVATGQAMATAHPHTKGLVSTFNVIGVAAALSLAFTIGDSWNSEEKSQGARLFRELVCDNTVFRKYVQFELERPSYKFDFVFRDTDNTSWLDSRRVLARADADCDSVTWQTAIDLLLSKFPLGNTFVWVALHKPEANLHLDLSIWKFQIAERLYSWSISLELVTLIICIVGSSIYAFQPASSCGLKAMIPAMVVAVILLVIAIFCCIVAHQRCLVGSASFRTQSSRDANFAVGFYFMVPVISFAILVAWVTGCMSNKTHGVPIYASWVPGIHGLWPDSGDHGDYVEETVVREGTANKARTRDV